jgi:hypothetical protein
MQLLLLLLYIYIYVVSFSFYQGLLMGYVMLFLSLTRYNAMVFEALAALKDTNGSDIGTIVRFIEVR